MRIFYFALSILVTTSGLQATPSAKAPDLKTLRPGLNEIAIPHNGGGTAESQTSRQSRVVSATYQGHGTKPIPFAREAEPPLTIVHSAAKDGTSRRISTPPCSILIPAAE